MGLPVFGFVSVHREPLADGIECERQWMVQAARSGRPTAQLWTAPSGLVAPRSYERRPLWAEARAAAAAEGWPVRVRASGGGLVPQGPGVWNLSLVWPAAHAAPVDADAVYRELAQALSAALARFGVTAVAQRVAGSFCDGRFNLAAGGRKLAGTAQAWRRIDGRPVALAHAVLIVTADPGALTAAANRFESASGAAARYRADALTSVAEAWCAAHGLPEPPADLERSLLGAIAERFARVVAPRVHPNPSPFKET